MLLLQSAQSLLGERSLFETVGILAVSAPALTFVYLVVKNRYFHPLRKFPGPFLASISQVYSVGVVLTEREHLIIEELHKKYGPIVRYQPNFLLFADPKMIPVIYNRQADKTEFNRIDMPGETPSIVLTIDHRAHTVSRRRIAGPYSMSAARGVESMIDNRIIEFKEILTKKFAETGEKMDFAKWAQFFAYDVVSEIAFGKVFGFMKTASDVGSLIGALHSGIKAVGVLVRWDNLKKIFRHHLVQRWLFPEFDKTVGIGRLCVVNTDFYPSFLLPARGKGAEEIWLNQERDSLLNERLELGLNPGDRADMMQLFINAKNANGSPMPLSDVKAELLLIMTAGSDTTAATIRGLLLNVLQTPGCYEKLVAEIDAFVKSKGPESSVITYDESLSLKYMTACIKESMRFSPATPILLPRAAQKGGLTLSDGRYIPEGTSLSANSHVTQRNKELYGEDADVFNPSRWLEDDKKNIAMEKYDLHFGAGSRVCLGKNIALLEIWKGTFEFFRTFKPTLIAPEQIKFRNIGLMVHQDLWITIEKRG